MVRTVSAAGDVAVRVIVATELVAEASARHGTSPTASAALGRTLMGTALLAAARKDGETLQIQVRGDGPLGQVTAISDHQARVRGYVQNPTAHPPPREGKLDVGAAVGSGILAVVRHHPSWREPYRGIVELVSGEIARDLAHYLTESEQSPAALGLGVFVRADGSIGAAAGYLIQALPGAKLEALARLEATIRRLPTPTEMVRSGDDADAILQRVLGVDGSRERHRSTPRFHCSCDLGRIHRAVTLLGRDHVLEIAEADGGLELRCEFCRDTYRLSIEDVGALFPDA